MYTYEQCPQCCFQRPSYAGSLQGRKFGAEDLVYNEEESLRLMDMSFKELWKSYRKTLLYSQERGKFACFGEQPGFFLGPFYDNNKSAISAIDFPAALSNFHGKRILTS